MAELDPNCASHSFAPPPGLDPNRTLLSLELVLALLPPQSRFVQNGGVGGRSRATTKVDVSPFPIVRSEQWKHGCEVEMTRKEPVDDPPERKGITRAAASCTRRVPLLDFDHGDQSAESRIPSSESGSQVHSDFRGKEAEIHPRKHLRH